MIINIRGTSGSGKSTVVRKALESQTPTVVVNIPGRKQPLGYWAGSSPDGPMAWQLAVPGHYETACGGCDTLKGYDQVFQLVHAGAGKARHVAFEGVLVSEEVKRTTELHDRSGYELLVIELTTPIEVCLDSIRARRAARGDERELNPKNTTNRVETIRRACKRLVAAGVRVEQHDRNSALARVMEIINGTS